MSMTYKLDVSIRPTRESVSVWITGWITPAPSLKAQRMFDLFHEHKGLFLTESEVLDIQDGGRMLLHDMEPDRTEDVLSSEASIALGGDFVVGFDFSWDDIEFDDIDGVRDMVVELMDQSVWNKHGSQFEGDEMDWEELEDFLTEECVCYSLDHYGPDDMDAHREAISNHTDMMCKDGQISHWTYENWDYDEERMVAKLMKEKRYG